MKRELIDILNTKRERFRQNLRAEEKWLIDTLFSSNPSEDETLLNQDYMAAYAISNGLGPLAYVQSSPQLQLSGFTLACKKSYFNTLIQNNQRKAIVLQIQRTLNQAYIPVLFIKGSLLAFTAYGDAGLRPMSDIDVLVSPDNAEKAYHLLLKAGFQGPTSFVDNPLSDHHLPPLSYQGQTIELHRYLFPPFSKYYINERVIWEHTQDYHMGDTTVLGLKPAFHALYIATHLYYTYRRGGMRLSWFYDLKIVDELLVDCHPNEINQLVRDLKIELPTSFIGGMYSVLSGKQLTNWPLNTSYLPKNAILKKLPTVFKPDTQQNTNESYHLVLEQIRRAPGLKLKYKLIHSRLTNHGSLTGTALLKHALLTMNRLSNYYLTQLVTFWRR